jgi:hypothetical protein
VFDILVLVEELHMLSKLRRRRRSILADFTGNAATLFVLKLKKVLKQQTYNKLTLESEATEVFITNVHIRFKK